MHRRRTITEKPQHKRLVPWPSPQDYNEAIQNLSTALTDPELKGAEAEQTALGLPRAMTGAFASVYCLKTTAAKWAIRCFLHNRADQHERYQFIAEHLERLALPYTVSFEYQTAGLQLNNYHYPLLKMEWAQGIPLNEYIYENLQKPEILSELLAEWKSLICWLTDHDIAHGDLQHGNVLVNNGKLKLVDYDGMFVPKLEGRHSIELGHRNYQHPSRNSEDFNLWLDHFPSWVIFTSIFCLSRDGSLWDQLGLSTDDECLLFKQADFAKPLNSKAFYILENHHNLEVRSAAKRLRSFLHLPIASVPNLLSISSTVPNIELLPVQQPNEEPKKVLRSIRATKRVFRAESFPTQNFYQNSSHQKLNQLFSAFNPTIVFPQFPANKGSSIQFAFAVIWWALRIIVLGSTIIAACFTALSLTAFILMHGHEIPFLIESLQQEWQSRTIPSPLSFSEAIKTPPQRIIALKAEADKAWSNGLYHQASADYLRAYHLAEKNGLPTRDKADILYLLADCLKNMGENSAGSVMDSAVREYLKDGTIDDQTVNALDVLSSIYRSSDRSKLTEANKYIEEAQSKKLQNHARQARLRWLKNENTRYLSNPDFSGSTTAELNYNQTKLLEHASKLLVDKKYTEAEKAFTTLLSKIEASAEPDATRADLMVNLAMCKLGKKGLSKKNSQEIRELLFGALANYENSGTFNENTAFAFSILSNTLEQGKIDLPSQKKELAYLIQYIEEFQTIIAGDGNSAEEKRLSDLLKKTTDLLKKLENA